MAEPSHDIVLLQLGQYLSCCVVSIGLIGLVHAWLFSMNAVSDEERKLKQDAIQNSSYHLSALNVFVWPWLVPTVLIAAGEGSSSIVPGILFTTFQFANAVSQLGYFRFVAHQASNTYLAQQKRRSDLDGELDGNSSEDKTLVSNPVGIQLQVTQP